jgi:hypothetical protein
MAAKNCIRGVLILILLSLATPGYAQQPGNLSGYLVNEQGAALPGVKVTVTGPLGDAVQVTDSQGRFTFLALSPGDYTMQGELEGFNTVKYPQLRIRSGRTSGIEMTLTPSVKDVITVTVESPLLDARSIATGTTFTLNELEKIPTARDPWAILQTTPGVLIDRVNVGGNESGQQSQYLGPGARGDQTTWAVDGLIITDMAGLGSPPAYFDFDSFEEMQVTTGGADATIATPGLNINIVTKRGTNEWRGSSRYFFGGSDAGRNPLGTRLNRTNDFGAELGGPIVKDRLWIWGSYGEQQIDRQSVGADTPYDSNVGLRFVNGKVQAQPTPGNRASLNFWGTTRRNGGVSPNPLRAATAVDEKSTPSMVTIEDTAIFGSNFYLSGMYSRFNGGFTVTPPNTQPLLGDEGFERGGHGFDADRDSQEFKVDASSFFNTGALSQEFRFGAAYRSADVTDLGRWPGPVIFPSGNSIFSLAMPENERSTELDYTSAYVQDTMSLGNLTVNFGLRYDKQAGNVGKSSISFPFNPSVPAREFDSGAGFEWSDLTPRLGLTYALGAERQTLLRASYSRFADQLQTSSVNTLNPVLPTYFYGAEIQQFNDLNGNRAFDSSEPSVFRGYAGFAPDDPRLLDVLNQVDENLGAPSTDELLFGVEHALLPEFVIGLNLTYRKSSDILDNVPLVRDGTGTRPVTAADYIGAGAVSGNFDLPGLGNGSYNTNLFSLRNGLTETGGAFLTNGDREQEYLGASLTFNKRLANNWMLRGNLTWRDWNWANASAPGNPTDELTSGDNAGPVAESVPLIGREGIFINSNWSYSVTGLYQIAPDRPWGFNVAGNAYGRQGYAAPVFQSANGLDVALTRIDRFRYPSPFQFDLRLDKDFRFAEYGLTLGVDVFNLFNEQYVLQRNLNAGSSSFGRETEAMHPRVFRFGARFSFR